MNALGGAAGSYGISRSFRYQARPQSILLSMRKEVRMTKDERDRLRELAKAATPGPWTYDRKWKQIEWEPDLKIPDSEENAEWCAAANPATILELLDENEKQDALLHAMHTGHESLEFEVRRLEAENKVLREGLEKYADPIWVRSLLVHDRAIQSGKLKGATYSSAEQLGCGVAREALKRADRVREEER